MLVLLVVVLLIVGLVLLALEVFVIPGFGVPGVLGGLFAVGAVGLAWWKLGPIEATVALMAGLVSGSVLVWYVPRTQAAKGMILTDVQSVRAPDPALAALVGAQGEARTPLRPSGSVEIAGRLVDVVSEGLFIDAGTRVQVTRVEGARVVVEPIRDFRGA